MSISYLAKVLLAERETIKQALDRLQDEGLVKYSQEYGNVEYKIQAVPDTVAQPKASLRNRETARAMPASSKECSLLDVDRVAAAISKHGEFAEQEAMVMAQRAVAQPIYQEFPGSLLEDLDLAGIPLQLSARRKRIFTVCGMQSECPAEKPTGRPVEPQPAATPMESVILSPSEKTDLEWEEMIRSIKIDDETVA
jgi:hypothetical protein